MKSYFIGIDISKDTLDICILDNTQKAQQMLKVSNTIQGIEEMIRKTSKDFDAMFYYCFEHTGNYGMLLARILETHGLFYYQIPALEIKMSMGIQRGKNDKIDAQRIAKYVRMYYQELNPSKLPGNILLNVKNLLTYRNQLVKTRTRFKNERKSFLQAEKIVDVSFILNEITTKINQLNKDIDLINDKIREEIEKESAIRQNFEKITKVKGIGMLAGAYMLVLTNNFIDFKNPRKFNCYAGLAPFENTSGSSLKGKTRTSRLRNKMIKTILFSGANSAIMHDQELKAYYIRKTAEGKAHNSVINAVCCKLVYRIFAVVNRDEPFVNLARYNLHMS